MTRRRPSPRPRRSITVRGVLLGSKKALAALTLLEGQAVAFGLLDSAAAGWATAVIGAATAAVVYMLKNQPRPR